MPYEAEISRANPTALLFVIDQSGSMADQQGGPDGPQGKKAENLATILNRILNDLVIRCTKGEEVFRYFQIGVVGYGNTHLGPSMVGSALGGALAKRDIVWIDELADNPLRIEQRKKKVPDGAGGLVEQNVTFPVWLEPESSSGTPMCAALSYTYNLVADWALQHPKAFPPVVIHITDGESTDGDPTSMGQAIGNLSTDDGNVLLFNLHLSDKSVTPVTFPNSPNNLPDRYAKLLYEISSELPAKWISLAKEMRLAADTGSRAFAFNADFAATVRFLEIGTRQPTQLR